MVLDNQLGEAWMKGESFSSTLRRKRSGAFTLQLLTSPLFMLGSLEEDVISTSHPNVLKDVPTRRELLNDWENYLLASDEPICDEGKARVGQRLTLVQNGLMVRVNLP